MGTVAIVLYRAGVIAVRGGVGLARLTPALRAIVARMMSFGGVRLIGRLTKFAGKLAPSTLLAMLIEYMLNQREISEAEAVEIARQKGLDGVLGRGGGTEQTVKVVLDLYKDKIPDENVRKQLAHMLSEPPGASKSGSDGKAVSGDRRDPSTGLTDKEAAQIAAGGSAYGAEVTREEFEKAAKLVDRLEADYRTYMQPPARVGAAKHLQATAVMMGLSDDTLALLERRVRARA